jgi:eukaryotic-like serine/threonine-protein kinase
MTRLRSELEFDSKIGVGYFGEVFLAKDKVHGNVAVKVLRQKDGEGAAAWQIRKQGLLAEGQRLKQAAHPNVVQVFQLLESDSEDAVHLVMEHCRDGSLQRPYEQGPICLIDLRQVLTQVGFGLQALHARGMLHRDIKPSNLLKDRGIVKLADFGLVTNNIILGYASDAGYRDHLAPEVWKDFVTSVRTDIWALGMTAYRLLHGAEWYSESPAPRLVVQDGGFADGLRWLPHVPKIWRKFLRTMIRDDSADRYQSAQQVIDALAKLPIEPNWRCLVEFPEVRWSREVGERVACVVWTKKGARRYEWEAWTEPTGKGRRRILGGSLGVVGYTESASQLRDFFADQR